MTSEPEFRKLHAYTKAIEAATSLDAVARALPAYRLDLRDQLQRAATSVVLNLAEGTGEFSPQEKARFYRMARRSATECQAILDLVEALRLTRTSVESPRSEVSEVGAMLTGMIRSVEARTR